MKKLVISICIGVFAAMSLVSFAHDTEQSLANGLIRMHVRANSNRPEDQSLKLKVRDRLLKESTHLAEGVSDIQTAQKLINNNLSHLKKVALDEIRKNGYDYPVDIKLGKSDFPIKTYGNITLPAGTYKALTVDIGKGAGENWWCVMFPPLCFTPESTECTANPDEDMLIENLGDDTYSMVNDGKVKIKFKIYEIIQNMW